MQTHTGRPGDSAVAKTGQPAVTPTAGPAPTGSSHPRSEARSRFATLVHLLRWRGEQQAGCRALTFTRGAAADDVHLTYGALDRRARAIAALLQREASEGDRVLLVYAPGLEFVAAFLGCLYSGVVAVPVYRPNFNQEGSLARLRPILRDAGPTVVLTSDATLPTAEGLAVRHGFPLAVRWLSTSALTDADAEGWRDPNVDGDTLAFLQYTSGSTTAPRGVMVSHGNLMHNEAVIQRVAALNEDSSLVSWLPLYHDMGLIGSVLQPLYTGFPSVLMSHLDFAKRPRLWLEAITRYGATASAAPNFAYDLCTSQISPEQRATLDLRSWTLALNGAEPIRPETLDRFAAAFGPCGFRREAFFPCYGLAEATLLVSGGTVGTPPLLLCVEKSALDQGRVAVGDGAGGKATSALVGSGRVNADQRVLVVDPESRRRVAGGQVGEIWVAGPSVAQGYWNSSEATVDTFHGYLADGDAESFLRTGDLGFVHDGQLFITSRLKDLIIIRGRNHAPQDIEGTTEMSHPALRPGCGAAFSVDVDGDERLVIVFEVKRRYLPLEADEVASSIRVAVAQAHEVDVHAVVFLKTGGLPKTSSGKVQRRACRDQFLRGGLESVGESIRPRSTPGLPPDGLVAGALLAAVVGAEPATRPPLVTAYLRHQISGAVGIPVTEVGVEEPFMALGLDSLRLLELKQRLETELGVAVPLEGFLDHPTIAALGAAVLGALEQSEVAVCAEVAGLTDAEVDVRLAQLTLEASNGRAR